MNKSSINKFLLRTTAIVLHIVLNVIVVTRFTDYDISGSWFSAILFIALVLLLAAVFIYHLLSFIHFIKTKT